MIGTRRSCRPRRLGLVLRLVSFKLLVRSLGRIFRAGVLMQMPFRRGGRQSFLHERFTLFNFSGFAFRLKVSLLTVILQKQI